MQTRSSNAAHGGSRGGGGGGGGDSGGGDSGGGGGAASSSNASDGGPHPPVRRASSASAARLRSGSDTNGDPGDVPGPVVGVQLAALVAATASVAGDTGANGGDQVHGMVVLTSRSALSAVTCSSQDEESLTPQSSAHDSASQARSRSHDDPPLSSAAMSSTKPRPAKDHKRRGKTGSGRRLVSHAGVGLGDGGGVAPSDGGFDTLVPASPRGRPSPRVLSRDRSRRYQATSSVPPSAETSDASDHDRGTQSPLAAAARRMRVPLEKGSPDRVNSAAAVSRIPKPKEHAPLHRHRTDATLSGLTFRDVANASPTAVPPTGDRAGDSGSLEYTGTGFPLGAPARMPPGRARTRVPAATTDAPAAGAEAGAGPRRAGDADAGAGRVAAAAAAAAVGGANLRARSSTFDAAATSVAPTLTLPPEALAGAAAAGAPLPALSPMNRKNRMLVRRNTEDSPTRRADAAAAVKAAQSKQLHKSADGHAAADADAFAFGSDVEPEALPPSVRYASSAVATSNAMPLSLLPTKSRLFAATPVPYGTSDGLSSPLIVPSPSRQVDAALLPPSPTSGSCLELFSPPRVTRLDPARVALALDRSGFSAADGDSDDGGGLPADGTDDPQPGIARSVTHSPIGKSSGSALADGKSRRNKTGTNSAKVARSQPRRKDTAREGGVAGMAKKLRASRTGGRYGGSGSAGSSRKRPPAPSSAGSTGSAARAAARAAAAAADAGASDTAGHGGYSSAGGPDSDTGKDSSKSPLVPHQAAAVALPSLALPRHIDAAQGTAGAPAAAARGNATGGTARDKDAGDGTSRDPIRPDDLPRYPTDGASAGPTAPKPTRGSSKLSKKRHGAKGSRRTRTQRTDTASGAAAAKRPPTSARSGASSAQSSSGVSHSSTPAHRAGAGSGSARTSSASEGASSIERVRAAVVAAATDEVLPAAAAPATPKSVRPPSTPASPATPGTVEEATGLALHGTASPSRHLDVEEVRCPPFC